MILIDTSAWVEFLRDTGSPTCRYVDGLISAGFATCDPIRMEVLAGARDERHLIALRRLMALGVTLPTEPVHYEHAAAWYRAARQQGVTVRRMLDCLIAAVAIDAAIPLLHADRDFDTLSRVSPLRVAR